MSDDGPAANAPAVDAGRQGAGSILSIEDVRGVAEWGGGHPVVGPLARTALFWHDQAERRGLAGQEWRDEAIRLGWAPPAASSSVAPSANPDSRERPSVGEDDRG